MDGHPEYIVFNGKTKALNDKMGVNVGEKVRLYVGNGGVNLISSFHVIGEIFDNVYPEAAIGSEPHHNVQTTIVPAGGASIVEFKVDVPGKYILVDHALARLDPRRLGRNDRRRRRTKKYLMARRIYPEIAGIKNERKKNFSPRRISRYDRS